MAVWMARPRMRRYPGRDRLKSPNALARRDHFASVACRLGHQREPRLTGFPFNEQPRERAADLLIGCKQEHKGQPMGARLHDRPKGLKCQVGPALHVVDARPVEAVALAAKPQRP